MRASDLHNARATILNAFTNMCPSYDHEVSMLHLWNIFAQSSYAATNMLRVQSIHWKAYNITHSKQTLQKKINMIATRKKDAYYLPIEMQFLINLGQHTGENVI